MTQRLPIFGEVMLKTALPFPCSLKQFSGHCAAELGLCTSDCALTPFLDRLHGRSYRYQRLPEAQQQVASVWSKPRFDE